MFVAPEKTPQLLLIRAARLLTISGFFLGLLVAPCFFLTAETVHAATANYYVRTDGNDSNDGSANDSSHAWLTIQNAVNSVANPTSDTIIINVAAGTYTTNNDDIDIDRNFVDLTIQGAGAPTTIVQPATSPGSATQGNFDIESGEYVTIDGFTIRYGRNYYGGTAVNHGSSGSLTLRDCIIDDNDSSGSNQNGAVTSSSPTLIENCTFKNNAGTYYGSAFATGSNTTARITNSTFYNNTGCYGQVAVGYHAYLVLTNNTITKGRGGVSYYNSAFYGMYMKNNLIYGLDSGSGIDFDGENGGRFHGSNNLIVSQDSSYFTDGVDGNMIGSGYTVNLAADLSQNNATNGTQTVAIGAGSAAINAGDSVEYGPAGYEVTPLSTDQRGKSRYGNAYDIGAFEYQGVDDVDPLISSGSLAANNGYADVTFNEGVYSTSGGSGALEASDLTVTLTQGVGEVTDVSITSLEAVDNSDLVGGETVIRAYLSITGTPRGVETIEIKPAASAIYDAAGNAAATAQTTGELTLDGNFEYYVRTDGNDSNDGSADDSSHAWLTIQHAIDTVAYPAAPTTIYVGAGTYTTNNDDIDIDRNFADLVIQGAGAGSTIVQPAADPAAATQGNFDIETGEHMTIKDMTIRYGRTSAAGPGLIQSSSGSLTLQNCLIEDNDASGSNQNGAVVSSSDTLIENCTFKDNAGTYYGSAFATGSNVTAKVTNSTFYNNTGCDGQIAVGYYAYLILTNNTITKGEGGVSYYNSAFYGVYLENNLIYGLDSGLGLDFYSSYTKVYGSNNLIVSQYRTCLTDGVDGNMVGSGYTSGLADSLADNDTANGTQTVAISADSDALNAGGSGAHGPNGDDATPPVTDQRGGPRVGAIDIGAYEYGSVVDAPYVSSYYPQDNATGISMTSNLVLNFSAAVDAEAGADNDIVIKRTSDDAVIETIDAQDAKVTGSGTSTITINPAATLAESTEYYVQIGADAFDNAGGDSYGGISDTTSWSFTTVDNTAPTVVSISSDAANGTYKVGDVIDIDVTFSENVTSTGNVTVTLETGDTDRTCTFTVADADSGTCNYTVQEGDTSADLDASISGSIADQGGNALASYTPTSSGLAASKALVIEGVSPTVSTLTPADDATNVALEADLVLEFSESVTTGSGNIVIKKSADNSAAETIDVTSGQVTGSGTATITVNPASDLEAGVEYYVQVAADAFVDATGNNYAGISDTTSWSFTTIDDFVAPTILSISSDKANGTYAAGEVIDIDVTFSENVTSTGNVTVTLETGDTDRTCTFTVADADSGTCNYTVVAGDTTLDLNASITGTIADQASNALSNFTPAVTLAENKDIVIDTTEPAVSDIAVVPAADSAAITWITDDASSSQVQYGLTSTLLTATTESDISPRVTSHSVTISNLKSCAKYYYQVISKDAVDNQQTSTLNTFYTTGCPVSSVGGGGSGSVAVAGGSVAVDTDDGNATITAPENYYSEAVVIQVNKLNTGSVPTAPTDKALAGDNFFELLAVTSGGSAVNAFDNPVTFTIAYGSSTESQYYEDTLDVYKYASGSWTAKECTVDAGANTLTCSLPSFSTYAVFGEEIPVVASGSEEAVVVQSTSTEEDSTGDEDEQTAQKADIDSWEAEARADDGDCSVKLKLKIRGKHLAEGAEVRIGSQEAYKVERNNSRKLAARFCLDDLLDQKTGRKRNINVTNPGAEEETAEKQIDLNDYELDESEDGSENEGDENNGEGGEEQKDGDQDGGEDLVPAYINDAKPEICTYVVEAGDNPWTIAKKVYGDARAYPLVLEHNKDKYPDIEAGLTIGWELAFGCEGEAGTGNRQGQEGPGGGQGNGAGQGAAPGGAQMGGEAGNDGFKWWNPLSWW